MCSGLPGQTLARFGETWVNGDTVTLEVEIETEVPVSAIQLTIVFESAGHAEVKRVGGTRDWEQFMHTENDTLKVLLLDTSLGAPLPAGRSAVIHLSVPGGVFADVDRRITIHAADFAGGAPPDLNQLGASFRDTIPASSIRLSSILATQGMASAFELNIDLAEAAAALQFDIDLDRTVKFSLGDPRAPSAVAVGMYVNRVSSQAIRVLLTGPALGGTIDSGSLRLVVPVHVSRAAMPGTVACSVRGGRVVYASGKAEGLLGSVATLEIGERGNILPLLQLDTLRAQEDVTYEATLTAFDADSDPVAVHRVSGPSWMMLEGDTLSGRPGETDVGLSELCVSLDDSFSVVEQCLPVDVVNRVPNFDPIAHQVLRVGKTTRVDLSVRFCGTCRFEVTGLADARVDSGRLLLTPEQAGRYDVTAYAIDGEGATSEYTFRATALAKPKVRIDEVLADPPRGASGDANGDGNRSGYEDEFIEIVNLETRTVDIGGWRLSDDDTDEARQFAFPPGTTLKAGERAVLFGGGIPDGPHTYADDGRIGNGLTNSGDGIVLFDPIWDDTIDAVTYGEGEAPSGSWQRVNDAMTPHGSFPGHAQMSPGRARAEFTRLSIAGPDTVDVGSTSEIAVYAHFSDGFVADVSDSVTWVSSHASTRIDDGLMVAETAGKFALSARWRGHRRDVQVWVRTVQPDEPAVIAPQPPPTHWRVGREQCYTPDQGRVRVYTVTSTLAGFGRGHDSVCWTPEAVGIGTIEVTLDTMQWSFDVVVEAAPTLEISEVLTHPIDFDGRRLGEFIELHNYGTESVDVSGMLLTDDDTGASRAFQFPAGTLIPADGRVVLQGARTEATIPGTWFTDDGRIGNGLGNQSEGILLIDPVYRDTVVRVTISVEDTRDASLVPAGGGWVYHDEVFDSAASPGEAGTPVGEEPEERLDVVAARHVVLSELHPAPGSGPAGDTNGDGVRDPFADEFIELLNADSVEVDLSGWRVVTGGSDFVFSSGPVLEPGQRCVLFGGGAPSAIPGKVVVSNGRIGRGLPNAGGTVLLVDPAEREVFRVSYPATVAGVSFLVGDVGARPHTLLPSRGRLSPGVAEPTLVEVGATPTPVDVSAGDFLTFRIDGRFDDDAVEELLEGYLVEGVSNVEMIAGQPHAVSPGTSVLSVTVHDFDPVTVAFTVHEKEPPSTATADPTPRSEGILIEDLPPVVTVIVGTAVEFRRAASEHTINSSADWLDTTDDVAKGIPTDPGVWRLSVDTPGGAHAVDLKVIRPSAILETASPAAHAGLTWVWPIPAAYGLDVQMGRLGHYDPVRHAVLWRPESDDTGEREIDIAINAPGLPTSVLTRPVWVGETPRLIPHALVLRPDSDSNRDGKTDERDVYVEIRNQGNDGIDVGDWRVEGVSAGTVVLEAGTQVAAGEVLRVYGERERSTKETSTARRLRLIAPAGPDTLIDVALPSNPPAGKLNQDGGAWIPVSVDGDEIPTVLRRGISISPCPMRKCAEVAVRVGEARSARILVYNLLGQTVDTIFSGRLGPGTHTWQWCPDGLGSGTYLILDPLNPGSGQGRAVLIR